jgi:hypothetical protein
MKFTRIIKEPLFQFFLIGIVLYAVYALFGKIDTSPDENTVIVTEGDMAWMADSWTKRWNRPPTAAEFKGLIDHHIEESILYQESLKMGLDKNDVIIRRRLAQKLRFLQEDLTKPPEPTDEELDVYFNENIAKYSAEELITLTQIYFDSDKRDEATLSDAENTINVLQKMDFADIEPAEYGDNFILQNYYPGLTQIETAKLFGNDFAQSVMALKQGQWYGPIRSGYGTHLVYISERIKPAQPIFAEVREIVLEDWRLAKQEEINGLFIEGLLSRYTIVFEDEEGNEIGAEILKLKSGE